MRPVTAFETRHAMMAVAAERIAEALRAGIAARGAACAALSGGGTPEPAYAHLAEQAIDWPKVTFALVDERFLPPDHPYSNEGMLRRVLRPALEAGAMLTPLYAPGKTPGEAAELADAKYRTLHVDIAVTGMGADGHTASWFSGAVGLSEALDPKSSRSVVAVHAAQAAGSAERLTMTLSALARADRLLLLITGAEKRALLDNAGDEPVAVLFTKTLRAPEVLWSP